MATITNFIIKLIVTISTLWPIVSIRSIDNMDSLFNDFKHLQHDLKEQYHVDVDNIDQLKEHEKEFYLFRLHDYDGNFLLDGLELLSALYHDGKISDDIEKKLIEKNNKQLQDYWNEQFFADSSHKNRQCHG
ncbi:hypothetical protein SSS_01676 [Sarcoptes scabiei]|nr:hypothetical protein SSS_01676 [Sarcoptes scabiei]